MWSRVWGVSWGAQPNGCALPVSPRCQIRRADRTRSTRFALSLVRSWARSSGSSHAVFKTPWTGDPRVNIQSGHGKAKECQVCQVLAAIRKLEASNGDEE